MGSDATESTRESDIHAPNNLPPTGAPDLEHHCKSTAGQTAREPLTVWSTVCYTSRHAATDHDNARTGQIRQGTGSPRTARPEPRSRAGISQRCGDNPIRQPPGTLGFSRFPGSRVAKPAFRDRRERPFRMARTTLLVLVPRHNRESLSDPHYASPQQLL